VSDDHAGDALSALVDGELDPEEERAVRDHLAACPSCADELEGIRRSRRVVRLLPGVEIPADVNARLLAIDDPSGHRTLVPVVGNRRRLAAVVAVAASVAALALVGGPAESGPQPVAASLTGAVQAHSSTVQSGLLGALGPTDEPGTVATTAPPMQVDRLRAPYRAPVRLDGGYRLVEAFRHADGLQLLYQRGPYSLSVFELEGTLDRASLPAEGRWVRDDGEAAWQLVDDAGHTLVLLDRADLTLTAVGDASPEDVLRAARSFPDARDLPMTTRLRRACADALRALSPL
jgi:anti-sigma factor RsiW